MSNDKNAETLQPDNDDVVSSAYRQAAREQPPASLDNAILKMAHAEVNGIHVAPTRPRWFVPLSVAATVVVAVSLGIQVVRDPASPVSEADFAPVRPQAAPSEAKPSTSVPPRAQMDRPAVDPYQSALAAQAPSAAEWPQEAGSRATVEASPTADSADAAVAQKPANAMMDEAPHGQQQFAPVPAAANEPSAAPPRLLEVTPPASPPMPDRDAGAARAEALQKRMTADSERRRDVEAAGMQLSARLKDDDVAEADLAVQEAAATARREQRSVDDWLQLIETLHREGLEQQASIEWRALRLVYPQTELPASFPDIE